MSGFTVYHTFGFRVIEVAGGLLYALPCLPSLILVNFAHVQNSNGRKKKQLPSIKYRTQYLQAGFVSVSDSSS